MYLPHPSLEKNKNGETGTGLFPDAINIVSSITQVFQKKKSATGQRKANKK